jgi:hypothetical protein
VGNIIEKSSLTLLYKVRDEKANPSWPPFTKGGIKEWIPGPAYTMPGQA